MPRHEAKSEVKWAEKSKSFDAQRFLLSRYEAKLEIKWAEKSKSGVSKLNVGIVLNS